MAVGACPVMEDVRSKLRKVSGNVLWQSRVEVEIVKSSRMFRLQVEALCATTREKREERTKK